MKVLLVDDSKMFRKVMKKIISESFEVLGEACDGNEGFKKFQELQPDVTLLDITMPNCDGRECLKKIMDNKPNSKVVIVSGIEDQDTAKECLSLGAKGYINKNTINVSCPESRKETVNQIEILVGA